MSIRVNHIGERYDRLTVIAQLDAKYWRFRCECGAEVTKQRAHVTSGLTRSCGCLSREVTAERNRTHGCSIRGQRTPEYSIWAAMKRRCQNPKTSDYPRYGGRGIRVCDAWQQFENFVADMGPRPSAKHSIDRINNDGDYEPSNCRWATVREQALNRRLWGKSRSSLRRHRLRQKS